MQETWNYFKIIFFSFRLAHSVNSLSVREEMLFVKFIMNHLNTCKIINKIADYISLLSLSLSIVVLEVVKKVRLKSLVIDFDQVI